MLQKVTERAIASSLARIERTKADLVETERLRQETLAVMKASRERLAKRAQNGR